MPEILRRNTEEFAPGHDDNIFITEIANLVIENKETIDEIIVKAAPDWPLEKINSVDRNILRLGLTELLFGNHAEVPPKVAINEAIELAKTFSGDSSGKFVNGVLGAVYKEMGEPGKDQISKKKKIKENSEEDIENLPIEKKAGAVVYAKDNDQIYFALVHDVFGYWTLSKGGVEGDEEDTDAAVREIKEEIGLDISIEEILDKIEYIANHPQKGKIRKQVSYFLGQSDFKDIKLENESGGLDSVRWFPIQEITDLKIYDDIIPLLSKSIKIITKQ